MPLDYFAVYQTYNSLTKMIGEELDHPVIPISSSMAEINIVSFVKVWDQLEAFKESSWHPAKSQFF